LPRRGFSEKLSARLKMSFAPSGRKTGKAVKTNLELKIPMK